ncbi:MAG: hypothetical protein LUI12_05905 [Clostridiales bacterium]|nr:hypothetical protein [Clostridiales bacterium]
MKEEKKEFDDSDLAWEVYKILYNIKDEDIKCDNNRRFITKTFKGTESGSFDIDFAGETMFNFSKGFGYSRVEKMKSLLDEIPIDKEKYNNNLNICESLMKSIVNISLIPKTGNMQLAKQGIGNDRLDTFLWAVNEYFDNDIEIIFNHSSVNGKLLKAYLNIFKYEETPINEFCSTLYCFNTNTGLVDELIEFGTVALDSPTNVMKYMTFAYRMWRLKIQVLESRIEKSKQLKLCNNVDDISNEIGKIKKELEGWY